jgi:putative peptidoglycan lipid II flippase
MTLLSRVLGLIRDMVVANLMGAGAAADVFFFANKIPNFLRRLFAEGAFAQAFVPVLSEVQRQDDEQQLKLFIARVAGTLGTFVLVVTLLGVIGSPVLAALFGTGWFLAYVADEPAGAKFELASLMLKITFPYLFFITLTGLSGAILNTLNRFAVAAFTPVLLNVCIISAAIWLSPQLNEPAIGLAWGVFFGGIVQLLFQWPFLRRTGLLVRPRWGWQDEKVSKVRRLMIPALFGVSVSQINLMLDTLIASFLMTGSISWLYYSDRLLEFPLGLFGIAIATVILPTLSRNHASADSHQFRANMDWALRMVCILGIPASAGLIVLAEPLLTVLFVRGEFAAEDARMASYSLMAYGAGLLSFMLVKVFAPGFFSRQDTRTPVRYGIWAMVANMLFNIILAIPFGYVGLAMATALSATLNAFLLYQKLHRLEVYRVDTDSLWFIARVIGATGAMAGLLLYLMPAQTQWADWTVTEQVVQLSRLIGTGAGCLALTALVVGIRPKDLNRQPIAD